LEFQHRQVCAKRVQKFNADALTGLSHLIKLSVNQGVNKVSPSVVGLSDVLSEASLH